MGKLGNKFKSVIIVLVAVLSALAAFPFAANLFGVKQYSDDELSEVFAGNEPSDGFNPGTYVSKYPTVNSSVVFAGYSTGSAILANDVTFTSSYNNSWDSASSAMYAQYNLSIDGDGEDDMVFSSWISRASQIWGDVPAGTYDVLIRLYFHDYRDSPGTYTYSAWKEIGTTTISKRTYNKIMASSLGHSSNVTNGTIQITYKKTTIIGGLISWDSLTAYPFTGKVYTNSDIGSFNSGRYATSNSSSTKPSTTGATQANTLNCKTAGTHYLWFRYDNESVTSDWIYTGVSVKVLAADNFRKSGSYTRNNNLPTTVAYDANKHYLPYTGSTEFAGGTTVYQLSTTVPGAVTGGSAAADQYAVNVGTYNLYAGTAGDNTFGSSSWIEEITAALTITKGTLTSDDITVAVGQAPHDIVYGNNRVLFYNPPGVAQTVTGGLNGGSFSYGYSTASGATGPSTTVSNLSDITSNLGVGTYTLWYKITGDKNWNDTGWFKGTSRDVPQADGSLSLGSGNTALRVATSDTLYYNGGEKTLFTGTPGGVGGTVYYAVTTDGNKPADTVGGSEGIPTPKTPATYTLYYRRAESTNYKAVGWTSTGLSKEIKNGLTSLDPTGLTVTSGTVTYGDGKSLFGGSPTKTGKGTVYYYGALGNTQSYTPTVTGETDISKVKGSKANVTIYLWYRLDGDTYYNDVKWTYTGKSKYYTKASASLKKNTLAISYSSVPAYTGSAQQIFKNEAAYNTGGGEKIVYGLSTKSDSLTDATEYDSAAAAKPKDAGTWYLWYKSYANDFYSGTNWAYSGVYGQIKNATQTTTSSLAVNTTAKVYDKGVFNPFSGKITVTKGNTASDAVTYGFSKSSSTVPASDDTAKATTSLNLYNVGTYYLWYKIAGTTNYDEVGWKYFSTTSVAKITQQTNPTLSGSGITPKTNLKYDGSKQTVFPTTSPLATCTNGDGTITYCLSTTQSTFTKCEDCEWGALTTLTAKHRGTYYLYAKKEGTSNTVAITTPRALSISVTIGQKTDAGLTIGTLAVKTTSAVYFNNKSTGYDLFKNAGSTTSDGTIQYAVGTSSTTAPTTGWTDDITEATAKAATTHYLWYKVDATNNCAAITPRVVKNASGTALSKAISKLTTPVLDTGNIAKNDSTYNGETKTLFKASSGSTAAAGSTGDGTIYYAVVKDSTAAPTIAYNTGKTTVASLTDTRAGKYYLWYAQAGTENSSAISTWTNSNIFTTISRGTVDDTDTMTGKILTYIATGTTGQQILFDGSVTLKFNNADVTDGHVEYTYTTTATAPAITETGKTDLSLVTEDDAGKYYGWWKFTGSSNLANSTAWQGGVETVINKATPKLSNDGTSKLAGKTNLFYTAGAQTLFTGAGVIIGPSDVGIEYGYATNSTATTPSVTVTAAQGLSELKATDGYNSSGGQITHYLFYRLKDSDNITGTGWQKVYSDTAKTVPVTAKIGKASLTITPTLMPECNYDTQYHAVFTKAPTLSSTSTTTVGNYTVNYKVTRTYIDGRTASAESTNYASFSYIAACKIVVEAKWSLKEAVTGTTAYQYATQTSYTKLGETEIKQIDATNSNVTVSGFTHNDNLQLSATSSSVTCSPYKSVAVDLKVLDYVTDNGITTNQLTLGNNETNNTNQLSYILTKEDTAPSDGYTPYATAAELNAAIKARTVSESGTWYLWFKVVRHANLTTGSTFLGDSFIVAGFDNVTLQGLKITGATSDTAYKHGTVAYNGSAQNIIASGTLAPVEKVTLGKVSYAISDSATDSPTTGWQETTSGLTATTARTKPYYLWVKWEKSDTVAASSGRLYGWLTVNKYEPKAANLGFTGLSFSAWGSAGSDHTFSQPFNNKTYALATGTSVAATVTNNTNIKSTEFGTFQLALGDTTGTSATGSYVDVSQISSITAKNAGTYTIWVKWSGGTNVAAGSARYRYLYDGSYVTPKFNIAQATSLGANTVKLQSTNIATVISSEGSKFKYDFLTSTKKYTAKAQPLFDASSTTPAINFNDVAYTGTVSYKYLLSEKSTGITTSTTGWATTINTATASLVNDSYYLWVMVTIDDSNASLSTVINTNNTAKIVAANSFVDDSLKPVKNENLVANGSPLDLVTYSTQISPAVEYSLDGTTFYPSGHDAIRPTDAGNYTIYWRGAATADGCFVAQPKPNIGYPFYTVMIKAQDAKSIAPTSKDVIYNGVERTAQELFTAGYALIGENEEKKDFEYAWDVNEESAYVSIEELATKTDAGNYTLWYRYVPEDANSSEVSPTSTIIVIKRAPITIDSCPWTDEKELAYKAADYTLLSAPADYTIDGTELKYSTGTASEMGKLHYAVTTSATEAPALEADIWTENYNEVKARTVGAYYIWIYVDDEGKNHEGQNPVCYNPNSAIKIVLGDKQKYDATTCEVNEGLRYNGDAQKLIKSYNLVVSVPNRDNNGEVVEAEYNTVPTEESQYELYYYLSKNEAIYPSTEGDLVAEGWSKEYAVLEEVDAAKYYLIVYIKTGANSNVNSEVISTHTITILPAAHGDIKLSGIVATPKEFTGELQSIAGGELSATIPSSNKVVTDEITEVKYCYVKDGDLEATNESTWSNNLEDAKESAVGKYQLYVWLKTTTNIDQARDFIVPVLGENLAEITRIDGDKLKITGLTFVNDLVYSGEAKRLVAFAPKLQMKNNNDLMGQLGAVKYYISGSNEELTTTGTTQTEIKALDITEVKEINAGTYYIWVEFSVGENHEAIEARYVDKVTIAAATANNITLSGIETINGPYKGLEYQLIASPVEQKIGDYTVTANDYASVEYGYSNNPNEAPSIYVSDIKELKAIDADDYYIWVRVTGKENEVTKASNIVSYTKCYSESEYSTIYKATLTLNSFGVKTHNGLRYIGEAQSLASFTTEDNKVFITLPNNSINLNTETLNSDIECLWALGEDSENAPETGWTSDISALIGENAGDYYIWVKMSEAKNFNEFTATWYKTVTIGKADVYLETAPVAKADLVYNGYEQNLLETAPVIKFRAKDGYYGEDAKYYEANGIVVKYKIVAEELTADSIEGISVVNAGKYEVYFYVEADATNSNWEETGFSIEVEVSQAEADAEVIGLNEKPNKVEGLFYNASEQKLVTYGSLACLENGRGAGLEGSTIVFYYNNEPTKKYYYYYDTNKGEYVWLNGEELPGKKDIGTYEVVYYVTTSETGNLKESTPVVLTIEIERASVYWVEVPEEVKDLKYAGKPVALATAGVLSVADSEEVVVEYSVYAPEEENRNWMTKIPEADSSGIYTIWYRVRVSSNYTFVGEADNEVGTMLVVNVGTYTLAIRNHPTPKEALMYTGTEQELVMGGELSTDNEAIDNAPYIEYSLDKKVWTKKGEVIEAKQTGTYVVYYRINYDAEIFEFVGEEGEDGRTEPKSITVTIGKLRFDENTLKAVYDGNKMTFESSYPFMNEEIAANINESSYSYRKQGATEWQEWTEDALNAAELGTYEFKITIEAPEGANYESYNQGAGYATYVVKGTRAIEINMAVYNTEHELPTIQAWIDFDGTTSYEDARFREEKQVVKNGKLTISFEEVDETSANAVIRIKTIGAGYYYMSGAEIDEAGRKEIVLSYEMLTEAQGMNEGLTATLVPVYVYEVYRIQYDANGASGKAMEDSWKWHGIAIELKENDFTKIENETILMTNGWNDSKTGSGNPYTGNYTEEESKTLYAQFYTLDEKMYKVEWIIDNGSVRYALSRGSEVWVNITEDPERKTGVALKEGETIILPQVKEAENGESLVEIFGGYILGWYTEEDNIPYEYGTKISSNVTYVARLNGNKEDYVSCKFYNEANELIHDSGNLANGASAYMALSGLDKETYEAYMTSFANWSELNRAEILDKTKVEDGVYTYAFAEEDEEAGESGATKKEQTNYTMMFIFIGVGVVGAGATLVVYLILRKRRK